MADLLMLPTLPPDDEDDEDDQKQKDDDDDDEVDDDDDDADDKIVESFEYGGVLGEDGGVLGSGSSEVVVSGWSYEQALKRIQEQKSGSANPDAGPTPSQLVPRLTLASLIEAKRKALKRQDKEDKADENKNGNKITKNKKDIIVLEENGSSSSENDDESNDDEEEKDDEMSHDDDDDKNDDEIDNESSSSDDDDDEDDDENVKNNNAPVEKGDDDEGEDDSSSSSEEEEEIDDEELEQDVLKTRIDRRDDDDGDGDKKKSKDKKQSKQKQPEKKKKKVDDDDDDSNDDEDNDAMNEEEDDKIEAAKAAAFFDNEADSNILTGDSTSKIEVFSQLTLSRPILRGIAAMGFVTPTPIQARVLPLALAGRDICASAVTGSGKTAAFLLPILEKLLYRYAGRIKAVIVAPTRELAAQCLGMMTTLAQFTKLRAALIVGGTKNVHGQAAELRSRPDVVIATPGRLLDHLTNSQGVTVEDVDFLVLDEADRLLELGFEEQVHEIIKLLPVKRQTMLFSATMNTKVDELIKLSLKRPIRVRVFGESTHHNMDSGTNGERSSNKKDMEVAPRLEQEFVRVRTSNEGLQREAMLLALLKRTFRKQTIVFADTKATAHRLMILAGLMGIKCAELHGNLTQQHRLQALEEFRLSKVDVLLATDLAARGLDIDKVRHVINFEMPHQVETYIHRIGRTARAGRGGTSCTLIGENRRHLMKEIIRDAECKRKKIKDGSMASSMASTQGSGVIRSRIIPPAVVNHFAKKIQSLESHVEEIIQAEAVARLDRVAEMEAIKAENVIKHQDEIMARPKREWFTGKNRQQQQLSQREAELERAEKKKAIAESVGTGTHRMTRKKRERREALMALQANMEAKRQAKIEKEAGEDGDDNGRPKKDKKTSKALNLSTTTITSIKVDARKHKRKETEMALAESKKSIRQIDMERSRKKQRKGIYGRDAVGDSSLFDEDKANFASKKKEKKQDGEEGGGQDVLKSRYQMTEFDPNKKFGKKKSKNKFKSKSKHKRRH